ncbi:glycosyl hydrolase family 65 protein [Mycobacterium vicinigordonae]|uniref:Haloacid dehalogenase n=1 Tax=Mycobacterium vicinigordonae TaxID=1719132 RepID=A0A7D6DWP3_9MYCO|nr:glycosyl hydrolase family 65 protein [Mycobacterium vicinigordonae]QLL05670.1 haloacid dehalogenase [Mycobacterium vicinigordonae]
MSEWPAVIDRRYHDAVLLELDAVLTEDGLVRAWDSTVALLRRLREVGITTLAYSGRADYARALDAVGLRELFDDALTTDQSGARPLFTALTESVLRLGIPPRRCVVVAWNLETASIGAAATFALLVGIDGDRPGTVLVPPDGADAMVADLAEISVQAGGVAVSALPDALLSYSQLKELITCRRPTVFVDFDTTLDTGIGKSRAGSPTEDESGAALAELASQCQVVVLCDRDLDEVREHLKGEGLWFVDGRGQRVIVPDNACRGLARTDLDDEPAQLRRNTRWHRGKTVQWVLDLAALGSGAGDAETVLPIFIGRGLPDEDAFDAVRFGGLAIVVRGDGDGQAMTSAASFRLDGTASVVELLRRLAADLHGDLMKPDEAWELTYHDYDPDSERLRETLCTVGNGYLATRGCAPEATASPAHYAGTYAAGIYNSLTDQIAGRTIENESLVNLPNWLSLTFRIDGGAWFSVDDAELLAYRQKLDLRDATLTRELRYRDSAGRTTTMTQQRFASMHQPHVVAMRTTLRAENWSGTVEFQSLVDGSVQNTMVERYQALSSTHLTGTAIEHPAPDCVMLRTLTSQSQIPIAVAARNTVWRDAAPAAAQYSAVCEDQRGGHRIEMAIAEGEAISLEKVATVFTGRDSAISEPARTAWRCLEEAERYDHLHRQHARAWARLWEQCSVGLNDGAKALRILRLHLVHLLQTLSPHTAELDAGVPARGLHGEAYRGHIFWDALFVAPVLSLRMPNVTRSLLLYWYRRLPEARSAARRAGHLGAMFPWQSGSDGREASQELHLNPKSGRWNPDPSARAHHVGLAVAYKTWQHYQVTGDRQYLIDYGAEMLVEIARFWVSLAIFDNERGRYVIRGVIGPDEFHSGYPGHEYDGIDNNAYSNVMAVWVITQAMAALELLPLRERLDLTARIGLTTAELTRWTHVSRRMFVPFHDGVISQFEGYSELAELDWEGYRLQYGNIQRLDRILEAENDSVNRYKASKQADVLMLFYLLSTEELLGLFGRLDYHFTPAQIPRTIDYYLGRTSHGSTLSAVVHSWVLARSNRDNALEYFDEVLDSDVADIQGGTTAEGIHLAAMAGSVDLLQRCFTGLETRDDRLVLGPHWPGGMGPIEFPFVYRGQRLHLRVSGRSASLTAEVGGHGSIDVECRGQVHRLAPGQTIEVT